MSTKKTIKAPLAEAIVEIRFRNKIPSEIVLGLIYTALKDRYAPPVKLPVTNIPEEIRSNDPNLRYQPHHKFENKDFVLEVGPNILILRDPVLARQKEYVTWASFISEINQIVTDLKDQGVLEIIDRVGVRFANFFKERDIFDAIQQKLDFSSLKPISKFIGFEIRGTNNVICRVQLNNTAKIKIPDNGIVEGSIVDLDAYNEKKIDASKLIDSVEAAHDLIENIFFENIITTELRKELGLK